MDRNPEFETHAWELKKKKKGGFILSGEARRLKQNAMGSGWKMADKGGC